VIASPPSLTMRTTGDKARSESTLAGLCATSQWQISPFSQHDINDTHTAITQILVVSLWRATEGFQHIDDGMCTAIGKMLSVSLWRALPCLSMPLTT
jgi:hypothetical protein